MTDNKSETPETGGPFYEERWFQGTVAVVGLVSAIWALGGLPRPWGIIGDLFAEEATALSHTEIVLDTSAAMDGQFEGDETKFDAALRAIGQAGGRDDEGLALRRTSADCGGGDELLVDFGTDNKEEVLESAGKQQPEGKSNIVNAVVEAVGDFRNEREFKGPRSTRRVLVFTSGQDECFEGDVAGKIKAELEEAEVSASFTLIALKASGEDLQQLEELKSALQSADAYVETRAPDSSEELEEAIGEVNEEADEAIEEGTEEKSGEETVSG
jgi:hypothetical protein